MTNTLYQGQLSLALSLAYKSLVTYKFRIMKNIRLVILSALTCTFFLTNSCSDFLDEKVYSELAPSNLLSTEDGILKVLGSAYHISMMMEGPQGNLQWIGYEEFPTDIGWGMAPKIDKVLHDYTWDASFQQGWRYSVFYEAIRDANIVLENLDNVEDLTNENREIYRHEARFVRAYTYFNLYQLFGPVPLRINSEQEIELPRASEDELISFIESELLACRTGLPEAGDEPQNGRAHKAAARAYLVDLYMTTKRWEDAANMAQEIISMGRYALYPEYADMFKVENENNSEYIWIRKSKPHSDRVQDTEFMCKYFWFDFAKDPDSGLEWQDNWWAFPEMWKLNDAFVYSFHPEDKRDDASICERYINNKGDTIQALGKNDSRSFKFWPDPNAIGQSHGNDQPVYRYAEILLYRAEALNELNGPNQESIDLINQVRQRAGVPDLELSSFTSKEQLRNHLLLERGWEFYSEGKRRHDMIRMGVLIENAQARGITRAQDHHCRYPIPQTAMDANPLLIQNEGY